MATHIDIQRLETLPPDFDEEVMPESIREGFRPIQWLREDWEKGVNRFSEPGEAFYAARVEGRLVGVCGVNRDPFDEASHVGRLRRLYVLPRYRRMGVGCQLVNHALKGANKHFTVVRLRTLDDQSAGFFESLGFRSVSGNKDFTHEKLLK
jgi:N-acetylglutamate synthase-like GNAT family acetyltransferase